MDESVIIGPKVVLGKGAMLGKFVVIGDDKSEYKTKIGGKALIRSHSVIYGGNTIGKNFQTGHGVLVREKNIIKDNVSIGSHSVVEHHVKIGNDVRIHSGVFVPEYTVLEDGCWIGPGVVLTNARYPKSINVKRTLRGPRIKAKARIGANATILPGLVIGKEALVGAGAVVTKDVPTKAVVVGNPAKQINSVDKLPYE